MSARNTWIISAVILIVGFIAARTFVVGAIGEPVRPKPPSVHVMPERPTPAPPLATPNGRAAQRVLWKVEGAIPGLGAPSSTPELAHQVLLTLTTFKWTQEDWVAVGKRLDKLNTVLAKSEDPALQALDAHILATRIEVMQKAGTPDDALNGALETLEAEHPDRFGWRSLEPGPDAVPQDASQTE